MATPIVITKEQEEVYVCPRYEGGTYVYCDAILNKTQIKTLIKELNKTLKN